MADRPSIPFPRTLVPRNQPPYIRNRQSGPVAPSAFADALVPGLTIGFVVLVVFGIAGTFVQDSLDLETFHNMHLDVYPLFLAGIGVPLYGFVIGRVLARTRPDADWRGISIGASVGGYLAGTLAHFGGLLTVAIVNGPVRGPGSPRLTLPWPGSEGAPLEAPGMFDALAAWSLALMVPLALLAGLLARWSWGARRPKPVPEVASKSAGPESS